MTRKLWRPLPAAEPEIKAPVNSGLNVINVKSIIGYVNMAVIKEVLRNFS